MRYSPSTNGFYPDNFKYQEIPDDIIQIDDDLYTELIEDQSEGKIITPNGSDEPYLSDPPVQEVVIDDATNV
ncbi:hypothetical protein [Kluyvera chengduensis]|uniref:hypothetical protein n=1 Tax=Kluyvera sp. 142359 TaxID=3375726 RepID=UPI003775CA33